MSTHAYPSRIDAGEIGSLDRTARVFHQAEEGTEPDRERGEILSIRLIDAGGATFACAFLALNGGSVSLVIGRIILSQ